MVVLHPMNPSRPLYLEPVIYQKQIYQENKKNSDIFIWVGYSNPFYNCDDIAIFYPLPLLYPTPMRDSFVVTRPDPVNCKKR